MKIGDIVLFTMTEQQATDINRRRTSTTSIKSRLQEGTWPPGAQAHIGSYVKPDNEFPAIVVRVHGTAPGQVSLKVMLDGSDDYWCMALPGKVPGTYRPRD